MLDFSNFTSSVLQPEIFNFFPFSFPLWKKLIPSKIFFFQRKKKKQLFPPPHFPTLPSGWDFSSHPSHSSILLFNRKCQRHLVPLGDCSWELITNSRDLHTEHEQAGCRQGSRNGGWSVCSKHHHQFGHNFQKLPITQHTSVFRNPR